MFATSLLVSKYEINPLVYLAGHELRLQRLAIDPDKLVRRGCPGRQLHVGQVVQDIRMNLWAGLLSSSLLVQLAQFVAVHVDKHLGQAEELGNQLLER